MSGEYERGWADRQRGRQCDLTQPADYVRGWIAREDESREQQHQPPPPDERGRGMSEHPFERIAEGLREALAVARGDVTIQRTYGAPCTALPTGRRGLIATSISGKQCEAAEWEDVTTGIRWWQPV